MPLSGEKLGRAVLSDPVIKLFTVYTPDTTYLTDAGAAITSRGQQFEAIGLNINFPARGGEPAEVTATLPVVSNALANLIETIDKPVKVLMELIYESAPDDVLIVHRGLELTGLALDASTFTATLGLYTPMREPVPSLRASQALFPGARFGR